MNDVSSKPGPFICPPGFSEDPPDEELPTLDDEEEELCLIRVPWEFDIGLLKDQKIPLSGSVVVKDSKQRSFECKSFDATNTQLAHMKALLPGRTSGLVPFSFGWHLTVAETLVIPDIEELASATEQTAKHLDMPQGLCQRFLPFGSDEPVVTQTGSKKKKGHRKSQQMEDSPDSAGQKRKRLKDSKRKRKDAVENFSLQECFNNYKKSQRHSKESDTFNAEGSLRATDCVRIKEEPLSDQHENLINKAHKKNRTTVSESAKKSKKRKRNSLSVEYHHTVTPVSETTQSAKKVKKRKRDEHNQSANNESERSKRESFMANNYYVASEESDESWNSLYRTQSSRSGDWVETPKKKKKNNDKRLTIKEEVMSEVGSPHEKRDVPSLDNSSVKKKKKKKKRSRTEVRVKIEYPELSSSDY